MVVVETEFAAGYVTHGIATGNWAFNAVISGFIGATTATLGFATMGRHTIVGALTFVGQSTLNQGLSYILSFMAIRGVEYWN